uniref:MFS domain-containing protein n=1 Tax=Rhabditophanes sp. KR3021 TaxID=114890 RepID=A0AC35U6Y8_9BILA
MSKNRSQNKSGIFKLFMEFKLKDWTIFVLLSIANISVPAAFSCIAPFFNDIAINKGLTLSEIGIIFGVFNLGSTIGSILFGKLISDFGCKKIFVFGLFFSSFATACFSLTNLISSRYVFLFATIISRVLQAFGSSAFVTCSYTIAAQQFPHAISTIGAIFETSGGLGYALGPIFGGFLFEIGGYVLPFICLGSFLFIVGLVSIFFITDFNEDENSMPNNLPAKNEIYGKLLRSKDIILLLIIVVLVGFCYTSLDPILPVILKNDFKLSSADIGLLFGAQALGFGLAAPFFGYLVDNKDYSNPIYIFGGFITTICFYLMGDQIYSFFMLSPLIYGIIVFNFGISGCALYVPTFKSILREAQINGIYDTNVTISYISGIFYASYNLGGFLGPIVCSFLAHYIGYKWTMTIISIGMLTYTIIFILFYIIPKKTNSLVI